MAAARDQLSAAAMDPGRWQQIKETLASAMELESADRAAFLAQACDGDTALLREVNSLLAQPGQALDSWADAGGFVGHNPEGAQNEGRSIGAYELLRELGRGGMGAVWLARRADQRFEQQVAIKVLKRGTDTEEVLRRFQAERQILARLNHPNIARLFDGGETPDGLPYFVMELVEGVPITQFAREQKLPVRERLALFRLVCAAVSYAHRNLVIHRDLKPANVLVTREGEIKLLDFGIAKLVQDSDESALAPTIASQRAMTPEYASPEQLTGEVVTTVSDVYSLGVILFELLTGQRPHHSKTRTPEELAQAITRDEVEPPSTVTSNHRQLRGDLDRITLKALRSDPARRYSSPDQLSEDIGRHLSGLPVQARPDTAAYRMSKFIRRHRRAVAGVILLALTLLGGLAATAWQAHRAEMERRLAERRFQDVRRLAHAVVFDYHDQIAALPGSTKVRERLIKDALEYLDNLAREAQNDSSLLRELGTAYEKIGKVQGNSYYDNLGDAEGAFASYRKSLAIREQLFASQPNESEARAELADSREGLGDMFYTKGDLRAGLSSYESALQLRDALALATPAKQEYRSALAALHGKLGDIKGLEGYPNLGDTAGALTEYKKAESLIESLLAADPGNASTRSRLGTVLSHESLLADAAGDIATALRCGRSAVAIFAELSASNPNHHQYQLSVLSSKACLRFALVDNGQLDEAIAQSRNVISELGKMAEADPNDMHLRRNISVTYNALGQDLLRSGDVSGALENHRQALALISESGGIESDLDITFQRIGEAEAAAHDYTAALKDLRQALVSRETAIASKPDDVRAREDLANLHADIGEVLLAKGDAEQGIAELKQAVTLAQELATQAPTNAKRKASLARTQLVLAKAEVR